TRRSSDLIDIEQAFLGMDEVNDRIEALTFGIYKPMNYILPAKRKYYEELYDTKIGRGSGVFRQTDRESAVAALMKVNIFKRLESSIHSFNQTLERLVSRLEETINLLKINSQHTMNSFVAEDMEDMDDDMFEAITVGSDKIKIKLFDIDHVKWLDDLEHDLSI